VIASRMGRHVAAHLRANLAAYAALFIALGGVSYAAVKVPKNSVGTKQLKNGAVTQEKLEPAFFAKLSAPGARGPQGAQGAKGEAGQPGSQGATGPQGPQGVSASAPSNAASRVIMVDQGARLSSAASSGATPVSGLVAAGTVFSKSVTATTDSALVIQFARVEISVACPAASPQSCRISGSGAYVDGTGIPNSQASFGFPATIPAGASGVGNVDMSGAVIGGIAAGPHTFAVGFTQDQGSPVTIVGTPKVHIRAIFAPQG
jgi:hypothetical protein